MKGLFDCRAVAMAVVILLTACGGGGAGTGNADTTPAVGWQRPVDNPLIVPKLTAATQDFGPFFAFTVSVVASTRIIGTFIKNSIPSVRD